MREYKDVKKRILALLMCTAIVGTTWGGEIPVRATSDSPCNYFSDNYTYDDDDKYVSDEPDGKCDTCGFAEAAHSSAAQDTEDEDTDTSSSSHNYAEDTVVTSVDEESSSSSSCEHTVYGYVSNGDGTHKKVCQDCGDYDTYDCDYQDGVCIYCGYEKEDSSSSSSSSNCEHEVYGYTSNNDGTHKKVCQDCGDYTTEDCTYDDNGICKYCAYDKNESSSSSCEHKTYEYTSNEDGTHKKQCADCGDYTTEDCTYVDGVCKYCKYEKKDDEESEVTLKWQSFSKSFTNGTVTVSGEIPEGGSVEIKRVYDLESLEDQINEQQNEDVTVCAAFDITIYDADGEEYQPKDDGNALTLKFAGISEVEDADNDEVELLHISDDDQVEEVDAQVIGTTVVGEGEEFSTYAIVVPDSKKGNNGNTKTLESYQKIAYSATQSDETYLLINSATFGVYLEKGDSVNYTLEVYRDNTSVGSPASGTRIVLNSGSISNNSDENGIVEETVNISYTSGSDKYIGKGVSYAVIISGLGEVELETEISSDNCIYTSNSSNSYSLDSNFTGAIELATETTANPDDVTAVTISSGSRSTYDGTLYYVKDEEDTLKATLTPNVSRGVTWSSSSTSVAEIDSDGKLTAKSAGETTITATYTGSSGNVEGTIKVVVADITLKYNGNTITSIEYSGKEIKPTAEVQGYSSSAITCYYPDDDYTNVGEKTVQVALSGITDRFEKTFEITQCPLTWSGNFADAVFTINTAENTVESVTGAKANGESLKLDEDFTATLSNKSETSSGISYTITIGEGENGNYKPKEGSNTGTYSITGVDISELVSVEWKSAALASMDYTGVALSGLTFDDNFIFRYISGSQEGEEASFVNSDILDIEYPTDTNVGTHELTFKAKSGTGYTGELTLEYEINQADLSTGTITIKDSQTDFAHTGEAIEPEFTVTWNNGTEDITVTTDDYDYEYENNINVTSSTKPAKINVSGKNNFTGDLTVSFNIVASYEIDAEIWVNSSSSYKANYANNWQSGYSKDFYVNSDDMKPSVTLKINNKTISASATDGYTLSYVDANSDGEPGDSWTDSAGDKCIVCKGTGKYADKTVYAVYTINPMALSKTARITVTQSTTSKEYTGKEITLNDPSDYQLTFKDASGNTKDLTKDTDYTAEFTNNTNAGTATLTLTGKGNFTGNRQIKFTITAIDLSTEVASTESGTEPVKIWLNEKYYYETVYTGQAQEPTVKVLLNGNVCTSDYTYTYSDNTSIGTAKVTITGTDTGNFKNSYVKTFAINKKSASDVNLSIVLGYKGTNYDASFDSGSKWNASDFKPVYTGSKIQPTLTIKDGSTELSNGTDYSVSYKKGNLIDANQDNTYIQITGLGNYSDALGTIKVYFVIQPFDLSDSATTVNYSTPVAYPTGEITEDILPSDVVVKATPNANPVTLTADTDYTLAAKSGTDAKSAGDGKIFVVTGKGNYTGEVEKEYSIGATLENATVTMTNPYDTSVTYTADSSGVYQTTWANNAAPAITIKVGDTVLTKDTDYTVESIESSLDGAVSDSYDYIARHGDGEVNVITMKLKGTGGYYGEKEIQYAINPVDLAKAHAVTSGTGKITYGVSTNQSYTGEDVIVKDVQGQYNYGDGTTFYSIVGGTDYEPEELNLGVSGTSIKKTITGTGNFTGTQDLTFNITAGGVTVFEGDSTTPLDQTVVTEDKEYKVELTKSYEYTGAAVSPDIVVKNAAMSSELVKDTDYTITYNNNTKPTDGAKSAYAEIVIKGANYKAVTIKAYYEITTKSMSDDITATMKDLDYTAKKITTDDIKTLIASDASTLVVKSGDTTLTYGTDYEFATAEDISSAGITGDATGANSDPSYTDTPSSSVNWVYIKGINAYSGCLKVPFNIVLDISNAKAMAKVSIKESHYELNADGTTTTTMIPVIKYRSVDGAEGTYESSISESNAITYTTITRANDGNPGPDANITVTGNKLLKNAWTSAKYDDGTADGATVYFLANLANYSAVKITSGTTYDYTGSAITVTISGLGDAVEGTDYEVIYTTDSSQISSSNPAIDVGAYYAVVKAKSGSKYFVADSNTADRLKFKIVYNLSKAVLTIYDSTHSSAITSTPYSASSAFDIAGNAKITINDNVIYEWGTSGSDLVSLNYSEVKNVGTYTIRASAKDTDKVSGSVQTTFAVTGRDLSGATIKFYNADGTENTSKQYTYTGSAIEPTIKVFLDGVELTSGTDYKAVFNENVNVGTETAYITLEGYGAYKTSSFTPESGKFSITALDLSDSSHIVVEVEDATYAGSYTDPSTATEKVTLTPAYKVYYVDGTTKTELKLEDGTTKGDVKFVEYHNNTFATDYLKTKQPGDYTSYVSLAAGSTGNTTGTVKGTFNINTLAFSGSSVYVETDATSAQYTGSAIEIADIVKVYVGSDNTGVQLIQQGSAAATAAELYDYTITVTKGGVNYPTQVSEKGTYHITIAGANNCTQSISTTFTISDRSIPQNWHYYYQSGGYTGSSWTYDTSKKAYVSAPQGDDKLQITVYDVTEYTAGANNKPRVEIVDTGIDGSPTLTEGTDYTLSVTDATTAGTGEWATTNTSDDTGLHANVKSGTPAVTITGTGNYTGSITLPFNIGVNLETMLAEGTLEVTYKVQDSYNSDGGTRGAKDYTYGNTWQYTYNGEEQIPTTTVKIVGGSQLVLNRDYTITVENDSNETDESINAGNKIIKIVGMGNYCGTIAQAYTINKKAVTDPAPSGAYTKETEFQTENKYYSFKLVGSTVTRLDATTAKVLFGDDYEDYVGYYYAVYDGSAIEPEVAVWDNSLGHARGTSRQVDAEDVDISYVNSSEAFNTTTKKFSEIVISFKTSGGVNYYATDAGSATYQINYIIAIKDISYDFDVQFKNGTDGPEYDYTGKPIKPEITVTDGTKSLTENTEYTVEYEDNILPGVASVVVTGMGNYSGTKTKNFYIWGNLGDTEVCYKDDQGNYIVGTIAQDYTGEAIDPNFYLTLPTTQYVTERYVLAYTRDGGASTDEYQLTSTTSTDDFWSNGTVNYTGMVSNYWKGTKSIEYAITYDESNITATNYETSYYYTGEEIKPDFGLSVATAKITDIKWYRSEDLYTETSDFTSVGTIVAMIYYEMSGTASENPVKATYEIKARPMSMCTIICPTNNRYTGSQVKPNVTVYINTGSDINVLEKDTDYTVNYGTNIIGNGTVQVVAKNSNLSGSVTKLINITLGSMVNLTLDQVSGDSTSLQANWVRDIYSDGAVLQLYKVSGDTETAVGSEVTVTGTTNTYTFTGLTANTTYRVKGKSYATYSSSTIYSAEATAENVTGISPDSITVKSNSTGKVTVKWSTSGDVIIYRIYRADSSTATGKKVASYPASTGSYTNSGLTSGQTYYYYVEGWAVMDGKLTKVSESEHIGVTVK